MEIRLLKYFVTLCEEMNYVRAANRLFITQPTLSQQIKSLETELETPLFYKENRQLTLTEAGEFLQIKAYRILKEVAEAQETIAEIKNTQENRIQIGSAGAHFLNEVLGDFSKTNPDVFIKVSERSSLHIVEDICNEIFDLGIVSNYPYHNKEGLTIKTLAYDELKIVMHESHPLANENKLSIAQIKEERLILVKRGMASRELLNAYGKQHDLILFPMYEFPNYPPCLDLVRKNLGVTILPKSYLRFHSTKNLAIINIADNFPKSEILIVYRQDKAFTSIQKKFIQYTKKSLA